MKLITQLFILLILAFCTSTIYPQYSKISLTNVDEAITIALENNPDISVYMLQQNKASLDYRINKNFFLPNISSSISFQNNLALQSSALSGEIFGQPGQSIEVQLGQQYNYNAGLNLTKVILDKEAKLRTKISKISKEIATAKTEVYKQTLKEQTAFYYYSALISKEAVSVSEEDLKNSDSILQLTVERYKEGLIDITIKNKAKVAKNKVEQNLLSNQNIFEASLNKLKLLLGTKYETQLHLNENILEYDKFSLKKLELTKDKNLILKTLEIKQNTLAVKKERAALYPKLSLNGYFGKQQLNNELDVSLDNNSWNNFSYIGASLSVPIFKGLSQKNKIKVAKINKEIALQNFQIEEEKTKSKDNELLAEYKRNTSILHKARESFKLTKTNCDLILLKYQQGLINLEVYLKSYEEYLKAKNNYLNSLSITFSKYATILSR